MIVLSPSEQILGYLDHVDGLYHRLILVVARSGEINGMAIKEVARHTDAPVININLEMSRRMLDMTELDRAMYASQLLEDALDHVAGKFLLLDHLTILFDVSLKQDPLRLLQRVSRNRIVVAAWCGVVENGQLIYAEPGHPEFRSYPAGDLLVVTSKDYQSP